MSLVRRAADPLTGGFQDLTGSNRWCSAKLENQQVTQTETNSRTGGSLLPFLLAAGFRI